MSYILEALKKADRERMVGHVPDLEVVHTASAPIRRSYRWYWLLGVLLVINGLLVAGLMLRENDSAEPASEVATPVAPAPAPAQVPERVATAPAVATPRPAPVPAAPAPRQLPWKARYQPPARQPEPAASVAAEAAPPASAPPATSGGGRVVFMEEPLTDEPEPVGVEAPATSLPVIGATGQAQKQTTARSESVLPDWDDLPLEFRSSFEVPHIDVHVYDTDPRQRFILVNLIKYRPGDRLESGALLEQITPDGVQLLFRGKRFIYRP